MLRPKVRMVCMPSSSCSAGDGLLPYIDHFGLHAFSIQDLCHLIECPKSIAPFPGASVDKKNFHNFIFTSNDTIVYVVTELRKKRELNKTNYFVFLPSVKDSSLVTEVQSYPFIFQSTLSKNIYNRFLQSGKYNSQKTALFGAD